MIRKRFMIAGLFVCSLLTPCIYAQEFGVRVGCSLSYFSNDFIVRGGNAGLLVGGIINVPLSNSIQITGSIDYNQLSGRIEGSPRLAGGIPITKESNITIHTAEAAVLGGYKLPLAFLGDASPFLMGGVSIGYTIGAWDYFRIQYSYRQDITRYSGNENIKSLVVDWLPAWNAGLRFATPLEDGLFTKMLIDVRMRSSFDPPVNTYWLTGSSRLPQVRSISVSIGLMF